ncbi:hypothetical protein D4L85_00705 [Chryseolinea soli]|uniref:Uncharacterized protein n=2 Tax=Chryseolinea soli TaxID=2321403 RepID=A0A385SIJ9_9BACT|nr:hypothetical protein D4L85_00705 [Chryseolinea soli]
MALVCCEPRRSIKKNGASHKNRLSIEICAFDEMISLNGKWSENHLSDLYCSKDEYSDNKWCESSKYVQVNGNDYELSRYYFYTDSTLSRFDVKMVKRYKYSFRSEAMKTAFINKFICKDSPWLQRGILTADKFDTLVFDKVHFGYGFYEGETTDGDRYSKLTCSWWIDLDSLSQ